MSATSIILLVIVLVAIVVVVAAWLYERASREVSLVRTGLGGRKVVLDGGVIVLPYFHKVSRVNMQTMRLEVNRHGEQALIHQRPTSRRCRGRILCFGGTNRRVDRAGVPNTRTANI